MARVGVGERAGQLAQALGGRRGGRPGGGRGFVGVGAGRAEREQGEREDDGG
jgi:hypothetical protein